VRHLLDVDELDWQDVETILETAERYRDGEAAEATLAGRRVALLFTEPSTRTRLSFEVAARNLGAETFVLDPGGSSLVKGETLRDTARTLSALGMGYLVVRHHRAGAPWVAARHFAGHVLNAGDGWHGHPTQALLDLLTLRRAFAGRPGQAKGLAGRKIAIVGDLRHSRVARSNLWTLSSDGAEVWACGPGPWLRGWQGGHVTESLDEALRDADAVMALRVQRERMTGADLDLAAYIERYQLTEERMRLCRPGAVFLHPGPVNEGIEVTREVAAGPRSLVLEQVGNGVPVRMAVLALLAAGPQAA
jgi:aspartate carbamoyltransferase catalytic subunit